MFCRNYMYCGQKIENNTSKSLVWVALYTDETPGSLTVDPTEFADIDNFPKAYANENTLLATGSLLVAVSDSKYFLCTSGQAWVEQTNTVPAASVNFAEVASAPVCMEAPKDEEK